MMIEMIQNDECDDDIKNDDDDIKNDDDDIKNDDDDGVDVEWILCIVYACILISYNSIVCTYMLLCVLYCIVSDLHVLPIIIGSNLLYLH